MNIDEMRAKARAAVNATRFESFLPVGMCESDIVVPYLHQRRAEIVAAARQSLNDHEGVLSTELVLRLLFGEVSEADATLLAPFGI